MKRHVLFSIFAALLVLSLLAACAPAKTETPGEATQAPAEATEAPEAAEETESEGETSEE